MSGAVDECAGLYSIHTCTVHDSLYEVVKAVYVIFSVVNVGM